MLFEGLALVITGASQAHLSHLLIFVGPILATLAMILLRLRRLTDHTDPPPGTDFQMLPILKLSFFIIAILTISNSFKEYLVRADFS